MATKKQKKSAPKSKRGKSGQLNDEQLDKVTGGTLLTIGGAEAGIASGTGGAGAGKIKFNEFTIKKTTDS